MIRLPINLLLPLVASIALIAGACSPLPDADANKEVLALHADSVGSIVVQESRRFFEATPQAVGLSVGVIYRDTVSTYHFGAVSPAKKESPGDQTIYGIGSITKTVTATLLARAAHEKRVDLQDDIRNYIAGHYPNLEQGGQPITLAQLVNHTSGLPNTLPDRAEMYPDYPGYEGDVIAWIDHISTVFTEYTQAQFFADLHEVELDTIPGTRFSYSNAGAQLAGFILEKVYGRPYEVLADSFVFSPLGMRSTGIGLNAENAEKLATGYDEAGRAMPPVLDAYGAAGALKSTIADLARYARWQLDERDPVVRLTHTPPDAQDHQAQQDGFALGLNWQMMRYGNVRRIWQDGNVPGFSGRVVVYPELDLALVVLANQLDRTIPGRIEQLADAILEKMDERTYTLMEAL